MLSYPVNRIKMQKKKHIYLLSVSAVCRLNGLLGDIRISKSFLKFQLLTSKHKGLHVKLCICSLLEYSSC